MSFMSIRTSMICRRKAWKNLFWPLRDCWQGATNSEWIESFKRHRNIQQLTRNILIELVDKIVIYEGNRIIILFNFRDQYEALEMAWIGYNKLDRYFKVM
ncbi:DUF4368 domain-containing protein [Robinsoniella peoriensis]|uniref:DUF4368 domain-containing protein n=1 Tax=Robinsoniella peoriensis TaxID=180332 RepID=UPI00362EB819